jgi:hypothetical protein
MQPLQTSVVWVALLTTIGTGLASDKIASKSSLIGLWEENSDTVHAITLRKADGTYRRKEIQEYDYSKPALSYHSSGHWKIVGGYYIAGMDRVSAAIWKRFIGRKWKVKIIGVDAETFRYVSTDGADVAEQRIGDSSDAQFDKRNPKPLLP